MTCFLPPAGLHSKITFSPTRKQRHAVPRCSGAAPLKATPLPAPPHHWRIPVIGFLLESFLVKDASLKNARKYGEIYTTDVLGKKSVIVTTGELARHVLREGQIFKCEGSATKGMLELLGEDLLINIDGALHRKRRNSMSPALMPSVLPLYWGLIRDVCRDFCKRFEANSTGDTWCMSGPLLRTLTFQVIVKLTLATELDADLMEMQELFGKLAKGFIAFELPFCIGPYGEAIRARDRLKVMIGKAIDHKLDEDKDEIEELRKGGTDENSLRRTAVSLVKSGKLDAISILLAQFDPEADDYYDQAVNATLTFWFAGSETTSAAALSVLHELSNRQSLVSELVKEQERIQAEHGDLTYKQLGMMDLLDGTITEVLRMRSPASGATRFASQDTTMAGYKVSKGTFVAPDFKAALRDPADYPNPDVFDPRRYIDNRGRRRDVQLLTFGGGSHVCLGASLVKIELVTFFATLLRNYDIVFKQNEKDNFVPLPIVQPVSQVPVKVAKRAAVSSAVPL